MIFLQEVFPDPEFLQNESGVRRDTLPDPGRPVVPGLHHEDAKPAPLRERKRGRASRRSAAENDNVEVIARTAMRIRGRGINHSRIRCT